MFLLPKRLAFQQAGDVPDFCEVSSQQQDCVTENQIYLNTLQSKIDLAELFLSENPDNEKAKKLKESVEKEKKQYIEMMDRLMDVLRKIDELTNDNLNTDDGRKLIGTIFSMIDLVDLLYEESSKKYPSQHEKYKELKKVIVSRFRDIEGNIEDVLIQNDVRVFVGRPLLPENLERLRDRVDGQDVEQFFPSVDGLGHLGEGVAYYALRIPDAWDTPKEMSKNMGLVCNWKKVTEYNKDVGRTIEPGTAVHIPAYAFLDENLRSHRQVSFLELTIDEASSDKLDRVLKAMCEPDDNLSTKVMLFGESYFYGKPHPRNRYAIPVSMLREDWREHLMQEFPTTAVTLRRKDYKNPQLFSRMTVEGLNQVHPESFESMKKRGLVRKVADSDNFVWGLNGAGKNEFPEDNRYLTPYAEDVLNEIGSNFKQAAGGDFFRVTSMYRSRQYQKDLSTKSTGTAAAFYSTHFFGNSFDISKKYYCGSGGTDLWAPNGDKIKDSGRLSAKLLTVLSDLQEQGKIMFILEGGCYHVAVLNPNVHTGIEENSHIARPHRPISPEPERAQIYEENIPENFDPLAIEGFEEFQEQLLTEMRARKTAGNPMSLSEIQAKIVNDLLPKVRAAELEETARLLEGRSWEVAHVYAILISRHESQDSKAKSRRHHLFVYDEDPDVGQDLASFTTWRRQYGWFERGKYNASESLTMATAQGKPAGRYEMYKYLTESNVSEFIDPNLLMALAARETGYIGLDGGGECAYTKGPVFGYFQITGLQGEKIETKAKVIFDQLDDSIPGETWNFKEFKVNFNGQQYSLNPKMEIALAIAILQHNVDVLADTNHNQELPDQELLSLICYNGGRGPIEYLLQFGVYVNEHPKASSGKYKLTYVNQQGEVVVKWVSKAARDRVWTYLTKAMRADNGSIQEEEQLFSMRHYFRETLFP
ncbi:hypothetical protein HN748_04640, partial [Candidatus Peregrinibacteria bacterium]|nr:hypothetical protein [Candidatus Peregrinibacteria bacterium]